MLDAPKILPADPGELRETAEGLLDLVKAQALKIAKLEHQLSGHNRHRFGSRSESMDQLQLKLEEEETAAAHEAPKAAIDVAYEDVWAPEYFSLASAQAQQPAS